MPKSEKGDNSAKYLQTFTLPKVNQVIYTTATIYMPNIMILAQDVIQIFCPQGSIGLQCVSRKREIIQPNIHRILGTVNQVIYTLDTICVSVSWS